MLQGSADRLYATLVLPYERGGYEIDEEGYRRLLRHFMQPKFVDAGGGIIANPEAGELFYLTREEKRRVIEIAVEECGSKVPVFAGVHGATTAEALDVARDARDAGADGLFICPPTGMMDITIAWDAEKYPEIWTDMVKEIVAEVPLPAITHPVASISPAWGIGFPLTGSLRLCEEVPEIVGWKMTYSYEGFKKMVRGLRSLDHHVGIFGAAAHRFHEHLACGELDGASTGGFNYAMEPMIDHIEAWRAGDHVRAREIWESGLSQLHEYVWGEWTRLHIRYKIATWLCGLIDNPFMRPPCPRPLPEEVERLRALLQLAGLPVIDDEAVASVVGGSALTPAWRS